MTSKEVSIDVDPESDSQNGVQHLEAQHADIVVDEHLSKKIARKYDLHLLIFFTLINLFCFIDRVNIGNVRLLGLAEDLDLNVGLRFNIALMCMFVPYCVVELPANILCKRIGGHIWIPFLVSAFAIITVLTSVVQNRGGLYAARFFLGLVEGGVSPGLIWLLSQFYKRQELGLRTNIYVSAASASGAFGGLLAIGLSKIPDWGLIHRWRNVYFFEGLISLAIGGASWVLIPRGPETAKFLTEEEKKTAVNRLLVDSAGTAELGKTSLKHIVQALKSPHVLGCAFGFYLTNTVAQSVAVFVPSIIRGMGYSNETAQLLSVGPYAVACIISVIAGYLSDKYKDRSMVIIIGAPVSIVGFFMLEFLPNSKPAAKYGALYLASTGYYAFYPMYITWAANNCATGTVRAAGVGLVFTLGSLAGVCAPWIYLPSDAPGYRTGHAVLLSFLLGTFCTAIILRFYCKWENRQKDLGKRDHLLVGLTPLEEQDLSSKHPAFRYML
ncbi:uncharacterized protein A1O9_09359 [Exophiala aquamarina CBS 119918]|uniref:Major facilitator superfamily (MFS) profile domain-containing protein n=1 Tax=Exophiala aquamarina CBS 119918 TaxID=1182545 RepID=A0A072P4Y3_9EURO|nr:uncharacterized protein A1O9_09359 [Exophiala aquamarina CBS 119918]KEF54916.1 hypothetical protein A1O9_09359 [Exophiala aquamarina CBS 119918]